MIRNLIDAWIRTFKDLKNWKEWDNVSQRIFLFEIAIFFLGLVLAIFIPFIVQCIIIGIIYIIGIVLFLLSEYGRSGVLTGIYMVTLYFHPIIVGFFIADLFKLIF